MKRPRPTIRGLLVATAACAVALGLTRAVPRMAGQAETSRRHDESARDWRGLARLAEEGVATIEAMPGGRESVDINHFVPRPRPSDPDGAAAFDRTNAEVAAKCRRMARHHERLGRAWAVASWLPGAADPVDRPPPLALEAPGPRDASY